MSDIFGRTYTQQDDSEQVVNAYIQNPKTIIIESPKGFSDSTIVKTEEGVVLPLVLSVDIHIDAKDLANTATLKFLMPKGSIKIPAENIKIIVQEYENHSLSAPSQKVDSDGNP